MPCRSDHRDSQYEVLHSYATLSNRNCLIKQLSKLVDSPHQYGNGEKKSYMQHYLSLAFEASG